MTPRRPPRTSSWSPAISILAFFTIISLLANAFLLWLVWSGWQYYQSEAPPLLEDAADMGRALQESVQEPLQLEFPIEERLSIQIDVPIDHTVEVVIDDSATVDRTYLLEWELPVVGLVTKTIPIQFDVPIHIETPIHVSTTVPISVAVPIDLNVPLTIDLMELPLGEDLVRLGQVLEELDPGTTGP